jgi:predicted DNA-binding transcriptional regulator AlpA
MHRHRTHRRATAPSLTSSRALRRWHPAPVRYALARGRLATIGAGSVLVTASDDQRQIAHAAWSILAATGGLIDRTEIARRYGLSRGRVHQLTRQRHFPRPVQGADTNHPLWLAIDVEHYRSQPPPVGRPPKRADSTSA